jgi:hypothetical protein
MIYFNPHNPEIEKIFNRLTKNQATLISNSRLATDFSRHKAIRRLREKNHIYIGYDRQKHQSIVFFPPNVKCKKNQKKGYFFFEIKTF